MRLSKALAAACALTWFTPTGAAHAQAKDDTYYHFEDDDLVGDTLSGYLAVLKVRPGVGHVTLIRPRASFVGEMLKSVELM